MRGCVRLAFLLTALVACGDRSEEPAASAAAPQAAAVALEPADEQRRHDADMQIKTLIAGLEAFRLDNTRYPTTREGLDALIRRPPNLKRWEGPYLKAGLPRDPWGNVFIYSGPRAKNKGDYKLASYGADGRLGGEGSSGDISNRPATDDDNLFGMADRSLAA